MAIRGVVVVRRGVSVVLGVRGLVQHRHVVVQRHEDVLGHDGVQQAVEVNEEGDHLPGEVAAHLQHVPPDHARVVDLGRIILSCNKTRIEYFHLIRLCLVFMPSNRSSNIIHSYISCTHCSLPQIVNIGVLWWVPAELTNIPYLLPATKLYR